VFRSRKADSNEFVRAAADAGYITVDLVPPEYFSLVADHGLKTVAIAGHRSLTVGLNKRDQHARIKKEIEAKIVDAVRYGIPNSICFSGNRDGLADDKGGEITAEGLALLVPLAEREGITLILELLNSSRSSRFIRRITPLGVFAQTYGVDEGTAIPGWERRERWNRPVRGRQPDSAKPCRGRVHDGSTRTKFVYDLPGNHAGLPD